MSKVFGFIPLTWTRIGDYSDGVGIYLCDKIVALRQFDAYRNDWDGSKVKHWLNEEFYNHSFSEEQKKSIVFNAEADASVFLLSAKEYMDFRKSIPFIEGNWWLRSPGLDTNGAAVVNIGGDLDIFGSGVYDNYCVRPAILMKEDV